MYKDKIDLIVKDYVDGVRTVDIYAKYHISSSILMDIIREHNIPQRIYPVINKDLSKFKDLSNPETQYWIGYLCADGNIINNLERNTHNINLYSIDTEAIENFSNYFERDIVKIYPKKDSNILRACINSKELVHYFINDLNIPPRKSRILDPNVEYTPSFILGYFDGDGCIVASTEKRKRYECSFVSGSIVFITKLKAMLDSIGINSKIIQE